MKRASLILLAAVAAFAGCLGARAQSFSSIASDRNILSVEARGVSIESADSLAVDGLAENIARRKGISKPLALTYSSDIRSRSQQLVREQRKETRVMRYIPLTDIDRVFDSRRQKIREMLSLAETAEGKGRVDVALRNCSWAEVLAKSLPEGDGFKYWSSSGEAVPAGPWAASLAGEILGALDASFVKPAAPDASPEVRITYKGEPVQGVDYKVFDGSSWGGICHATAGRGAVDAAPGADLSKFRIRYETVAPDMIHINREVAQIRKALGLGAPKNIEKQPSAVSAAASGTAAGAAAAGALSGQSYRSNAEMVKDVKQKILDVVAGADTVTAAPPHKAGSLTEVADPAPYLAVIDSVCSAIADRSYDSVRHLFTDEGYSIFDRLIRYGNARLLERGSLLFFSLGDEVYCRSIPMSFSFSSNSRTFAEDVVFALDSDHKVTNITFSVGKQSAMEIIGHSDWSEEARIILINFLENYKTAYSLKRLDYIKDIFDDAALIIIGRVVGSLDISNEFTRNRYVSLLKMSKEQYIKRLEISFRSKEFINIQFSDDQVMRMGKNDNLYGIQIRQDYFSSNYSDSGYLFLLVDMTDPDRPVIHIRTWQDRPDEEFGVIGPYHF